jgi:hypothetical protein
MSACGLDFDVQIQKYKNPSLLFLPYCHKSFLNQKMDRRRTMAKQFLLRDMSEVPRNKNGMHELHVLLLRLKVALYR